MSTRWHPGDRASPWEGVSITKNRLFAHDGLCKREQKDPLQAPVRATHEDTRSVQLPRRRRSWLRPSKAPPARLTTLLIYVGRHTQTRATFTGPCGTSRPKSRRRAACLCGGHQGAGSTPPRPRQPRTTATRSLPRYPPACRRPSGSRPSRGGLLAATARARTCRPAPAKRLSLRSWSTAAGLDPGAPG